jgi:CRP/FNR family transcriptional regulator
MAICRPGQPFGELTLSDDRAHRLLAEALTDVELCSIAKSALMQFAAERPQLSLRLTKWVDRQLQEVQVRLEELLFKDVPTRLARVLLRLAEEHGEPTPEGVLIDLPLTHQELAELIGSTRETTSLTLGAFTREGLLIRQRRRFLVHDVAALRQRAE